MTVHVVDVKSVATPPTATIPCNGNNLTLKGAGSSTGPDIFYSWESPDGGNIVSGQNSINAVVNTAGTYILTTTFDNGAATCPASDTIVVEEYNTLQAFAFTPSPLGCGADSTTLLQGGSTQAPNSTYLWTTANGHIVSGANSPSAVANRPGDYTLRVTNTQTGCTAEATVSVQSDTTPPTANATAGPIDCLNPQAALSGAGSSGGPGISYHWTSIGGGHLLSGQDSLFARADTAGIYVLTVTSSFNLCTKTDTVAVAANTAHPQLTLLPHGALDCTTDSLVLSAVADTLAKLAWTATAGGVLNGKTDSSKVLVASPGIYTLTATNPVNGCITAISDTIVQNTVRPIARINQMPGIITCANPGLALSADSSSSGPAILYAWTTSGGNIVSGASSLHPLVNASGIYFLAVTDTLNNCTAIDSVLVSADTTALSAIANAPQPLTCATTQVTLDASGSSTGPNLQYFWATNNGHILSGGDGPNPVVDAPGTYQLLLSNPANGCTSSDLAEVMSDNTPPSVDIAAAGSLNCAQPLLVVQGHSDLPAGEFTFAWTAADGGHFSTGENTLQPAIDAGGTYTLALTGLVNGCTAEASVHIEADFNAPTTSLTVGGVLNCNASSVDLTAVSPAPLNYTWLLPGGETVDSGDNPVLGATSPGIYLLTSTNMQNGCTATATASVMSFAPVETALVGRHNITCFGGKNGILTAMTIGGDGQFTYLWNTGQSGSEISGLSAGSYTLTVSDGQNCTATLTAGITQPLELLLDTTTTPPSAAGGNDGTASANPSGGTSPYSFIWSNGETAQAIDGLTEGFYTVTVQDANGCDAVQAVHIGAGGCNLQADISAFGPSCNGLSDGQANVVPIGGTPPFNYNWSSGGQAAVEANLGAGQHQVTVTDFDGCQFTGQVQLVEPPVLLLTAGSIVQPECPGLPEGQASVLASGGTGSIAITWSNGQGGPLAANLEEGAYSATATDANGCSAVLPVNILAEDDQAPIILADPITLALGLAGASMLTLANLGASVSDNCALASTHIEPEAFDCTQLGVREVSIQATDAAGNTAAKTIPVTVVDTLSPTLECPADVRHCAGEPTVTYLAPVATDNCLSLGGHFDLVSGLPSGAEFPTGITANTYSFTDASGNVGYCSFNVEILSPIQIALDTVLPDLGGQQLGGVQVSVSGSQPGYTYAWMSGGQTIAATEDLAGVGMGAYALVVTDAAGCTAQAGPFEVSNLVGAGEAAWMDRIGVFPNPTTGKVFLILPEQMANIDLYLSVYDGTGRAVINRVGRQQKQLMLDLSGVAGGLYSMVVESNGQVRVWKIVVDR